MVSPNPNPSTRPKASAISSFLECAGLGGALLVGVLVLIEGEKVGGELDAGNERDGRKDDVALLKMVGMQDM